MATAGLIGIAAWLLPGIAQFIWFFLFFGFVFTPFQSFVNARLVGMVGQTVDIPFVREATIILSGYRGVDIWFIPFPLGNYGAQTMKFREIELTGTQFTSIIRAEVFMVPIVLFTELSLRLLYMETGADPVGFLSLCPANLAAARLPAMPLYHRHHAQRTGHR